MRDRPYRLRVTPGASFVECTTGLLRVMTENLLIERISP